MKSINNLKAEKRRIFERIYQLAKEQNESELAMLKVYVDIYLNGHTPISLLAKEGHHDAVWFLINKLDASLNWAVNGAARGGHKDLMNQLIKHGASKHWALYGATLDCHDVMYQFIK